MAWQGLPELRRQGPEHEALMVEAAGGGGEAVFHQLLEREALQQRDDVREAFVKRGDIWIGVVEVAKVDRIENGVGRFVGDDVRTQAREDEAARVVRPLELIGGREVAEQQGSLVRVIVGVGIPDGVRVNAKPLDVLPRIAGVGIPR